MSGHSEDRTGAADELDVLVAEVRASVEAELRHERRFVAPDFVAVVAQAHARNPGLVSAETLREVGEYAPIVELGSDDGLGDERLDAELDGMIGDAREQIEADVAARRLAGIPSPPPSTAPAPARRELGGLGVALALVAIVVGLVVAIPRLLESFVDSNYSEAESSHHQAEYLELPGEPGGAQLNPPPRPEPRVQQAVTRERAPARAKHEDDSKRRSPMTDPASKPTKDPAAEPAAAVADRVAELEAKAQAHWAAGELELAQACYREILAIAGRSRFADLAYGDLFTLAHQRGDAAVETALWQEYLQVFPRGRFAEDARAGLCRRAAADVREACWRDYLADFPDAVHATAAQQALSEAEAEAEPSLP